MNFSFRTLIAYELPRAQSSFNAFLFLGIHMGLLAEEHTVLLSI